MVIVLAPVIWELSVTVPKNIVSTANNQDVDGILGF